MFGYVKPFIPNLRVKEYELYKSIYCGLCRSMKKHTGNLSRVTLSYDMTFFALVRMALTDTAFTIRKRRCVVHPLKKRPVMDDNEALAYAAYVGALLAAHKVEDNALDEKGLRKFGACLLRPYAGFLRKRAARAAYEIETAVLAMVRETRRLEAENCPSPDMPAEVFGEMLAVLLSLGLDGANEAVAREIGRHTGRFVYLIDAVCDYEEDRKKGAYNPFLYAFSDEAEMERFRRETLYGILMRESEAVLHAVNLLDFEGKPMFYACIENIITDGVESALSMAAGKEQNDDK